ncbi:MAG: RNA 2',3'-cyclic phosphodiesterase [Candidatus Aenigmatarchaeota archaeon]
MRAFLGISVPNVLKTRIFRVQEKFYKFDVKLVEKENLHFNLRFFGEMEEEKINKVKVVLEKVATQFKPFEVNISGIGAFPSKNYVKVVWLGVKEGLQTFKALEEMISNSLITLGFEKDSRFVPHLTLGRVRSGRNKNEIMALMEKLEDVEIGKMKIDKINIFQSKLTPKGPVYEEVFKIEL